jgi:hypothetical protein
MVCWLHISGPEMRQNIMMEGYGWAQLFCLMETKKTRGVTGKGQGQDIPFKGRLPTFSDSLPTVQPPPNSLLQF